MARTGGRWTGRSQGIPVQPTSSGTPSAASLARARRKSGHWLAIAAWPLFAAGLGLLDVWLLARLHLAPGSVAAGSVAAPWPWPAAPMLAFPLVAGVIIARQFASGLLIPGWRASIGLPVAAAAAGACAVTAGLAGSAPWWPAAILLTLPCGYGCAACVTMQLRPAPGVLSWTRLLARPLLGTGAAQAVVLAGIAIAGQPGAASTIVGVITCAAGLRLLLPGLLRGGSQLIKKVNPAYSLDLITPLLDDPGPVADSRRDGGPLAGPAHRAG